MNNSKIKFVLLEKFGGCSANETAFPVMHHEHTNDQFMLLPNGSLAHKLVHGDTESQRRLYQPGKYCIDDLVITHNASGIDVNQTEEERVVEFAIICVSNEVRKYRKIF